METSFEDNLVVKHYCATRQSRSMVQFSRHHQETKAHVTALELYYQFKLGETKRT
jgi:hypothetical protein